MSEYERIRSYAKIHQIGHKAILDLLSGPVVVEEKVDGSQFSFGVYDGELICRSKGQHIDPNDTSGMFADAVRSANELAPYVQPGWTYRAEYLRSPKHNTLAYDRIPAKCLMVFDIDRGLEDYLSPNEKQQEAERLGLECVPVFAQGILTVEDLREHLGRESVLGGGKVEGVTVKSYEKFGADGKAMMGKVVSEDFKERHEKDWKGRHSSGSDIKYEIAGNLRTEAVWRKAVQHARERGELEDSPRDIGLLMKELNTDIESEQREYIKDMLYQWARKDILRMATRGFPEWYKQQLMESVSN